MSGYDYETLVPKAKEGDQEAWRLIIERSAKLRSHIIRKLAGEAMIRRVGWEELDQVALEGVVEAVNRYDPDHPAAKPFQTVLSYRVRQAVLIYVAENTGSVRMPDTAYRVAGQLEQHFADDERDVWNIPDDELSEASGGRGYAGRAVRARLQPASIIVEDDEGNQDYVDHDDLRSDLDLEHIESVDYEALRFAGELAKVKDSATRQKMAFEWAKAMGYSEDVATGLLRVANHLQSK